MSDDFSAPDSLPPLLPPPLSLDELLPQAAMSAVLATSVASMPVVRRICTLVLLLWGGSAEGFVSNHLHPLCVMAGGGLVGPVVPELGLLLDAAPPALLVEHGELLTAGAKATARRRVG